MVDRLRSPQLLTPRDQVTIEAEREIIAPFFQSKHNGRPAGSGWNRSTNNARWGTDYWWRIARPTSSMKGSRNVYPDAVE